ncbi:MAG: ABC transporter substrate-binding protein [Bifidobacteriaceae bacterium]|jgi:NitT/TauT family transport system substrate-binding protein|nr:ABC transporter substrate-binding protein [Bifidobacteriaceae bacterium]
MKARLVAALTTALLAGVCACAPESESGSPPAAPTAPPAAPQVTAKVAALKGPTTMGLAWALDRQADASPVRFELSLHGSPDEISPGLVKGQTEVAAIPANLAAVLYSKGAQIKVAAVNTLGVLHVVAKNEQVLGLADLAGKKVFSAGKGTTPQYVLEYLLAKNGVDAAVEYLSEASEVATRLAAEDAAVAVLPEPYVTTALANDPSLVRAIDLTAEWDKVSDTALVTGVLVVADQFPADHGEAFDVFLEDYRASIEYTNANPGDVAPLIANLGIVPSPEVAEAAIPGSHLAFLSGPECKAAVSAYLDVLFQADPASVGGAPPDDAFYYGA